MESKCKRKFRSNLRFGSEPVDDERDCIADDAEGSSVASGCSGVCRYSVHHRAYHLHLRDTRVNVRNDAGI